MDTGASEDLFPGVRNTEGTLIINDRCLVKTQGGRRVVIVCGVAVAQYKLSDHMAEAYAMVNLVEQGWADQNDVARIFGCSARTVRRYEQRFADGGLAALGQPRGYPRGRGRLHVARTDLIRHWKGKGRSNREIARHLGVSEMAIRKWLRRRGWREPDPEPNLFPLDAEIPANPKLSAFANSPTLQPAIPSPKGVDTKLCAPPSTPTLPWTSDSDPSDRRQDRLMAYWGLLDDAAPLFGSRANVPGAGVLLALPALVHSGVFECAENIYGSLGPAFYGLRTSVLTLLLMALRRIKRPEGLKEHSPAELGRVLGLDRAPEVKTLRRKLARLAAVGRAAQFGRALAQRRVALRGQALGFLYIDGHVRVYHGQARLPKAHVARMRLSLPATTDYWVNDSVGDPLFVVTAEANAGLVKMLPGLLQELRALVGQRRVTVVFDRGGYSPKGFKQILDAGFDLLTYRKGRFRRVGHGQFQDHRATIEGPPITYRLADQHVRLLRRTLRLRQVTRLAEDGHQTPVLTSREDLPAVEVAYHMFGRWWQENFFKYLRDEYALDALVEYAVEPDDPTRPVPNPAWAAADAQVRQAWAQLERLQAEYGLEAMTNPEQMRRTMRGFKIAQSKLGLQIDQAWQKLTALKAKRDKVPRRMPVQLLAPEAAVVKLAPERKHLTNLIKMVAYQAESALVQTVAPHYRRVQDEGRTLIQSALASAAGLEVTKDRLHVTLVPLSSAHRTRAIAELCDKLNQTQTVFPGSRLRLCYAIREGN
jgi:transposase